MCHACDDPLMRGHVDAGTEGREVDRARTVLAAARVKRKMRGTPGEGCDGERGGRGEKGGEGPPGERERGAKAGAKGQPGGLRRARRAVPARTPGALLPHGGVGPRRWRPGAGDA